MIEETDYEVSGDIGGEESPVLLRHCFWRIVDEVNDVDPHETCVVGQVDWDVGDDVLGKVLPVGFVKSFQDGFLAEDTDLVQVCNTRVVIEGSGFAGILLLAVLKVKALKKVGTEGVGVL